MNTDTVLSGNMKLFFLAATIGTAVLNPYPELAYYDKLDLPVDFYSDMDLKHEWESRITIKNDVEIDQKMSQINTIQKFSKNIIENIENLDDDVLEVLNEKFWDLI